MTHQLNTPGTTNVPRPSDIGFTHIQLAGLAFDFPPNTLAAKIVWYRGNVGGNGEFIGVEMRETIVTEAATRNWLMAKDTADEPNWRKLESAMFGYLVSIGEVGPGTIVELP